MHSLDTRLPQGIVKCTAADSNLDFFLIHYNFQSIHAGIYYPDASLKTRFCLRGKHLLYEFCHKHNVHHKRIGKWIVSQSPEQTQYLEKLKEKAAGLGVDLPWIASKEIQTKEPNLRVQAALDSPSTGIIDSHAYMKCLEVITEE